jgi:pyruvate/2-oxoglutarate dehydrogenase complex dihydrolipoamide acyltransferase (E2) component
LDADERIAVSAWLASPGDFVIEGDRLVEVLTTAATFDVSAPATGRLASVVVYPDDRLETGQVLGWIDQ